MKLSDVLSLLSRLELKRDKGLVVLAIVLSVLVAIAVRQHLLSPEAGLAFLLGAFSMPGFFGKTKRTPPPPDSEPIFDLTGDDDDDDDLPGPPGAVKPEAVVRTLPKAPVQRRALVLCAAAAVALAVGCTPEQRGTARDALGFLQVACIVANAAMPDSKVAEVCGITGPFVGPMRDVLAGARRQAAVSRETAGSAACAGDAGADAQ